MSALPPKADMCGATRDLRFGPMADICGAMRGCLLRANSGHDGHEERPPFNESFDDLIDDRHHASRDRQFKRLCRFAIEYKFKLCGLKHRQVRGLFPFNNPGGVGADQPTPNTFRILLEKSRRLLAPRGRGL